MYGFEYGEPDPNDNVPTRAIKVLFRMQLPMLRPLIKRKVQYAVEQEVLHGLINDGKMPIKPSHLPLSRLTIVRLVFCFNNKIHESSHRGSQCSDHFGGETL